MQLLRHLQSQAPKNLPKASVVTIGNFDALHQGHRSLLQQTIKLASDNDISSVLLTFEPLPHEFFAPAESSPARLLKLREKWELLERSGLAVDFFALLKFNQQLANMSPELFVQEILVNTLKARYIVIGDDFRFGHKRQGDVSLLEQLGERYDFKVIAMPKLRHQQQVISSTWLRDVLYRGDFDLAKQLLNTAYSHSGKVIYGNQLGRELDCPTANIPLQRIASPLHGIYVVEVSGVEALTHSKTPWPVIASLGTRPAVGGKGFLLEVHLFNFQHDLYGRKLTVRYLKKLRDEWMFDSLEQLKQQIDKDCAQAKQYFGIN